MAGSRWLVTNAFSGSCIAEAGKISYRPRLATGRNLPFGFPKVNLSDSHHK
jgi:hypothetical protein